MESKSAATNKGLEGAAPDWVGGWMPQRHVEIVAEIEKLQEEARQIESLGRLLWQEGRPLEEAVRDVFQSVGIEAEMAPAKAAWDVTVNLDGGRRLLVVATGTESNVTNKSDTIRQIFEAAQGVEETDRIVLAANVHRKRPVADREWLDPATVEAMMIIKGLGVVFVTTAMLFRIWTLSRENLQAATDNAMLLHEASPGPFVLGRTSSESVEEEEQEEDVDESVGFADRLVSALKS